MGSLILALALEAGKLAGQALAARGKPGAAHLVNDATQAAERIRAALVKNASEVTNGEVTAEDVQAAFDKAHIEARGLVADATKALKNEG